MRIFKKKDNKSFELSISWGMSKNTPLQNYASFMLFVGAIALWSFTWVSITLLVLSMAVSMYPTKNTKEEN
ncbi:hypothetical protein [Bacillus wiedmannii]|uniref:hypothetical protein n=1 Tax=Bacillus wiedmannii TaxID=1890302 RepID=UPI000BF0F3BA|nr:hypothetical protein [Bacillus wiedmannii]PEM30147.1 hypothetical protein CN598_12510 [Bacillus wiedmannii]